MVFSSIFALIYLTLNPFHHWILVFSYSSEQKTSEILKNTTYQEKKNLHEPYTKFMWMSISQEAVSLELISLF